MRPLHPNQNGIIVPTRQTIKHGGQTIPYNKPVKALQHIDKLLSGSKPLIAITRKQGGLGDVLMTLPTVKAISKKYSIQVTYGTDFEYLDGALPAVLEGNPYISKVVSWNSINPEDYNSVIDLTCPCVAHEVPLAKSINRIDLFARHVGIKLEDTSIDYCVTEEERKWARDYLYQNGLDRFKLILVQPSSSTTNRDCPPAKIKDALTQILQTQKDCRALIITHNSDNIKTDWKYSDVHILNNFGIRKIAALMELCKLVICPDSSILHMASALHMPTVTIFGPTDAHARVNYHPEAVAIWPAGKLRSYPQWYSENRDGYLCWKLIEASLIRDVSISILNKQPLPLSDDLVSYRDKTSKLCETV